MLFKKKNSKYGDVKFKKVYWPIHLRWGVVEPRRTWFEMPWFKRHFWECGAEGPDIRYLGQTIHLGPLRVCFGPRYCMYTQEYIQHIYEMRHLRPSGLWTIRGQRGRLYCQGQDCRGDHRRRDGVLMTVCSDIRPRRERGGVN